MSPPLPNLDDRRFQDLVDDAKRLVQQHTRRWTDHNVSDPGVTLIETFAWMTDQLIYRLNRVPDRNYVTLLDLIGVTLFPPTAAPTALTPASALRRDPSCFQDRPALGDCLMIGLSEAVPMNAIRLRFNCQIEGVGVNPDHPPLIWEAWAGEAWVECEGDSDGTGGLNPRRPGAHPA